MDSPYNFFGKIICINLLSRPERKQHAEKVLRSLNIPAEIYSVQKDKGGGILGCFKSHIQLIRKAYDAPYDNILIFEDDIEPTQSYNTRALQECVQFMKTDKHWDIFYLGFFTMNWDVNPLNTLSSSTMATQNIVKYNPLATHAYIVSRRGMKKILETYHNYIGNTHYDIFLAKYANLQSYCYVPMLFNQRMCMPSDVEPGNFIERMARKTQCRLVDDGNLFYIISFGKFWFEAHKTVVLALIVVCIVLAYMIAQTKNK